MKLKQQRPIQNSMMLMASTNGSGGSNNGNEAELARLSVENEQLQRKVRDLMVKLQKAD